MATWISTCSSRSIIRRTCTTRRSARSSRVRTGASTSGPRTRATTWAWPLPTWAADGQLDLYATNITDPTDAFGTGAATSCWLPSGDGWIRHPVRDRAAELGVTTRPGDGALRSWTSTSTPISTSTRSRAWTSSWRTTDPRSRCVARCSSTDGAGTFTTAPETGCDVPGDQRAAHPLRLRPRRDQDLLVTQVATTPAAREPVEGGRSITVDLRPAARQRPARASRWWRWPSGHPGRAGRRQLPGRAAVEASSALATPTSRTSVEITWADGRVTRLEDVAAGTIVKAVPA